MRETVGIVRCPDYQENHLREAVTRLLEMLRLDRISRPDTLLFKPNMLSARRPEEGVTTHPGVLKVLGEALAGRILIGDSPANTARPIEEYWDTCGLTAVAASLKASLVKFEEPVFLSLKVRKKNVKIPVAAISRKIPMVNLPKLKTHGLTVITAATKNLYGCIPGYQKSLLHRLFLSPQDFSYLLIELYRMLRDNIFFHLVDAITIMDGNGPSAGRLRGPGYLIAGRDALAVDIVCGKLLGLKAAEIPFLKLYDEIYGLPKVDLLGDRLLPLSDVALPGLSASSSLLKLPFVSSAARLMRPFFTIRPVLREKNCRHCLACVRVCPVSAISREPKILEAKCIRCLCCFEVCPHKAIQLEKSWLARRLT